MASAIPEIAFPPVDDEENAGFPRPAELSVPTAATYWRTLRHLRWSQLGYLALRRVLPRASSPAAMKSPVGLREAPSPWPFLDWQPAAAHKMLATREFTFLRRTVVCNAAIPWNDQCYAKLWLYHLNYFDFLNASFTLPEEEPTLKAALAIALDWCAHNSQGTEVGWEPYALSLRIVNWLKFLVRHQRRLESCGEGEKVKSLLESLGVQVTTLERRLEKDLLGNHFLKNIKALLFAGAWLETPASARWWSKGEAALEQQLHEQILADGGHFERSPMYHAQILEDLAEVRLLCRGMGKRLACSELLAHKIQSMAEFLRGVLHPDGEIPLFNDSVLAGARSPGELLAMAESPDCKIAGSEPHAIVFAQTGYGVIRSPASGSAVIFDCGPMGPDHQPGHGHCDLLSYELSLHRQRVVVDTGASTYEPGPERSYERSTAAHNTVRVDGREQAEIWASFRVGRRPRVRQIRGGSNGSFPIVSGEHDAYRRWGVVHARTILLPAPDTWIVADILRGSGRHLVESFLHFHPRVRVAALGDLKETSAGLPLRRWTVEFADRSYCLTAYGAGRFSLLKSWYSEQFGDRQPCTVLRWAWQGPIPTGMIHVFAPAGASLPPIAADWPQNSIEVDGHKIPLG
ncbi:MAG: alginate lyase family protein [Terriglobia bacterium]